MKRKLILVTLQKFIALNKQIILTLNIVFCGRVVLSQLNDRHYIKHNNDLKTELKRYVRSN